MRGPALLRSALGAFALSLALGASARAQTSPGIAIVTNPRTVASDLSFLELRKIFLGEVQF